MKTPENVDWTATIYGRSRKLSLDASRKAVLDWNAVPTIDHGVSIGSVSTQRMTEWYLQCELHGVLKLTACVEVHRQRRGGIPVVRGTNFTVAQLLAEISETSGPEEVADNFDIEIHVIREILEGLSLLMNKPFVK